MQKVYLLRDNRKSGPFTLPDLLLQSPQPDDLVWIEGQSTGWTRLSDLELNLPAAEDHISTPETAPNLEAKAEALRRRALEVPPRVFTRTPQSARHIVHEEEPDEEPILFIDHRKQKNNVIGEVLMTVFIVALLGGGLLGGRRLFHAQEAAEAPAVTRISTNDDHAATASPRPVVAQSAAPVSDSQALMATAPAPSPLAPSMPAVHKERAAKDSMARITPANPAPSPDSDKVVKADPPKPAPATHTEEKPKTEPSVTKTAPPANDENAEPQKKKGLGQAIKNLFRKKKKDDAENSDQH